MGFVPIGGNEPRAVQSNTRLKIELAGSIAVDVEADGFFQEGLGDAEVVGQVPQLGMAGGDGIVQDGDGDQPPDGPFVRPVFMALPQIRVVKV